AGAAARRGDRGGHPGRGRARGGDAPRPADPARHHHQADRRALCGVPARRRGAAPGAAMSGELTGEIRYRSERHKGREILVLQVETLFSVPVKDQPGSHLITHAWRDATTADLTAPAL